MPRTRSISSSKLSPILKWAGGKERELKYILPNVPENISNYYEPFVGGGAVYMAINAKRYFINDKSDELISLYRNISGSNQAAFFVAIEEIIHSWHLLSTIVAQNSDFFMATYKSFSAGRISEDVLKQKLHGFITKNAPLFNGMFSRTFHFNAANFLKELQINTFRKMRRMRALEQQRHTLPDNDIANNVETSLKSAFYMHFRHIYNHTGKYEIHSAVQSAIFFFIRNFAYSGMFRYNASGHFNVPYGGIGYNSKNLRKKTDYLKSALLQNHLNASTIENLDFEAFLRNNKPTKKDFIFLDPPYDSEFSTYARNEFAQPEQQRLAGYLIDDCKAKWMLVIKNTPFISDLYAGKGLNILPFDKTYLVSFMNRNHKDVEHLLITNY